MWKLYDYQESGNGYKVRLVLRQLDIPFEMVHLDILKRQTRTPDFLSTKNPNGRIPVLEFEEGKCLWESNAILFYLAEGTPLLPDDRLLRAKVLQWMFFEQYSHEPYIATVRFWQFSNQLEAHRHELDERRQRGYDALRVMDNHLQTRPYFVGGSYSIADIALYAYTHVADEGGYDLAPYQAVRQWIGRVREQPQHVLITEPC
jgi:glutathione S-transferase